MQCLIILIIVVLIITTVTRVGEGLRTGEPGVGRSLRRLAERHNGIFRSGGIYIAPNVRFRYGHTWITVTSTRRRGIGKTTRAELEWPDSQLQIEVCTRRASLARLASTRGSCTSIGTGDAEFDSEFEVHTNQPARAKAWLSVGVRWRITQLSRFGDRAGRVYVLLDHGVLVVEKQAGLHRIDQMEQFCQLALQLYDQAMLTRATGIEFLAQSEAQPVENPVCKVCGETIDHDMVVCRSCRTPHHLDCWQYIGKCSVFACQETQYIIPAVASIPANKPDAAATDADDSDRSA